MFRLKITELILGEFSSWFIAGFCSQNFGPSVIGSVDGKAFPAMSPRKYQINLFGRFAGNDPVKNCRKYCTENSFWSVMLVVTMAKYFDRNTSMYVMKEF